jgi:serine/threonine protein kinase
MDDEVNNPKNTSITFDNIEEISFDIDKVSNLQRVENINDIYELGAVIGTGSYGSVMQARHRKLGLPCAIKVIQKEKMSTSQMRKDRMINELKILEKTIH